MSRFILRTGFTLFLVLNAAACIGGGVLLSPKPVGEGKWSVTGEESVEGAYGSEIGFASYYGIRLAGSYGLVNDLDLNFRLGGSGLGVGLKKTFFAQSGWYPALAVGGDFQGIYWTILDRDTGYVEPSVRVIAGWGDPHELVLSFGTGHALVFGGGEEGMNYGYIPSLETYLGFNFLAYRWLRMGFSLGARVPLTDGSGVPGASGGNISSYGTQLIFHTGFGVQVGPF